MSVEIHLLIFFDITGGFELFIEGESIRQK